MYICYVHDLFFFLSFSKIQWPPGSGGSEQRSQQEPCFCSHWSHAAGRGTTLSHTISYTAGRGLKKEIFFFFKAREAMRLSLRWQRTRGIPWLTNLRKLPAWEAWRTAQFRAWGASTHSLGLGVLWIQQASGRKLLRLHKKDWLQ